MPTVWLSLTSLMPTHIHTHTHARTLCSTPWAEYHSVPRRKHTFQRIKQTTFESQPRTTRQTSVYRLSSCHNPPLPSPPFYATLTARWRLTLPWRLSACVYHTAEGSGDLGDQVIEYWCASTGSSGSGDLLCVCQVGCGSARSTVMRFVLSSHGGPGVHLLQ